MGKFVTSLDATAYHDWTTREGIRDILQNGRDGAIQQGAKLTVKFTTDPEYTGVGKMGKLTVINDGAALTLRTLLTGYSSKRGDSRLAGKYGEGLPAACLALVRAGHTVTIRTADEVWQPYIEEHGQAGAPVLAFSIRKVRTDHGRIAVEIGGVDRAFWKAFKAKFLFLGEEQENADDRVKVETGTLLLGPEYQGDVYVKGIWVMHDPQLAFGYDFQLANTDRDRRMVEQYELLRFARVMWQDALAARMDLCAARFVQMFEDRAKDTDGIEGWNAGYIPEEARNIVAKAFLDKHGENAVPVLTLADGDAVGHFGKKGVIVGKGHLALLETVLGSTQALRENLACEVVTRYVMTDLTGAECGAFNGALALLYRSTDLKNVPVVEALSRFDIVDFRDPKLEGLHTGQGSEGRIQVARRVLADPDLTLEVAVHEKAHDFGCDGSKPHVAAIEETWKNITKHLRTRNRASERCMAALSGIAATSSGNDPEVLRALARDAMGMGK